MSDEQILTRLRWFLLLMSAGLLAGTVLELIFLGHTDRPIQWLPFLLCAAGLIVVGAFLFRPGRGTLLSLRAVMVVVVLGSLVGVLEHVEGNISFHLEIYPGSTFLDLVGAALGGANPIMAPGMLALAATYAHPILARARLTAPLKGEAGGGED